MKLIDKILIGFLLAVSLIMINDLYINSIFPNMNLSFDFLNGLFPFIFHFFAIFVPIYMLINWLIKKDKLYFYLTVLTTIPLILFIIWFFSALNALGE